MFHLYFISYHVHTGKIWGNILGVELLWESYGARVGMKIEVVDSCRNSGNLEGIITCGFESPNGFGAYSGDYVVE